MDNSVSFSPQDIPIRILTVDDEESIVEEIVDSLILQEIDVTGFSVPGDALAALQADPKVTVLMTDLDMPGLNGLELAERALVGRSDENALEVVLLTAHANLDSAIDAMRIGIFDLLRKPARLVTLRDTLERAHLKAVERRKRHRASIVRAPYLDDATLQAANTPNSAARTFGDGEGGSFLSAISHEMRTPLNPIIGFSQLIEQQSVSLGEGELKEYARYIREAGESLFDLTESVLKVTELKARPPKIVTTWMQPSDVLAQLRGDHLTAARARSQPIEIEDGEDRIVETDRDLLLQALGYLLVNAIVFSPLGARIVLRVRTSDGEIGFSVVDNGPGMTEAEIAKAVRPYEQLDVRHTRSHGGLGIGLTLASLLAGHLAGRLAIESFPGLGTTASVWIPLQRNLLVQ